ncbi:MAG: glycosyltransferase [Oscillospiraceae bacterium]|nr:glycosyltransferase [Oscillospiraceae bacterium]
MKILFSAGDFDKQLHAVNKIVLGISEQLCKQDIDCIFTGVSLFDNAKVEQNGRLKLVRFNSSHICDKAFLALENFVRNSKLPREQAKKKFYFAHPIYTAALLYRYNISKKVLYNVNSYTKQVWQLAKNEKPDALVVSYMPFAHAHALVTQYKWNIPVIAYQLDPWGLHCGNTTDEMKRTRIAEETAMFDRCAKIVTTPVLYRQYSQHPDYQKYLGKMVTLNFPNVKPLPDFSKDDCVFDFDKDITNLLFCGIVHDEYRNPQFLLNSLKSVRDNGFDKFRVHFLGTNESERLNQFMSQNNWVVHHGNVPLNNAFATMAAADVLINIGNTFSNQVPSKIFDYFAFGKPVLNIEKIKDCPAKEYFERYPLAFSLTEWQVCSNNDNIEQFLRASKDSFVPFCKVEKLFSDCTLTYATDVFYDIINKI